VAPHSTKGEEMRTSGPGTGVRPQGSIDQGRPSSERRTEGNELGSAADGEKLGYQGLVDSKWTKGREHK
jgi:hypothetical protein